MNPKVSKLREEHEKNVRKINSLEKRNKEIDVQIRELENTEIIGVVREYRLTPDQLAELLHKLKSGSVPGDGTELMEVEPIAE